MGKFIYDGSLKVDFDDRALAHLQVVIMSKLRRGESFHFTWKDDAAIGDGRTSIWLHPRCTLVFKFYRGARGPLNLAWVDALTAVANSPTGLYILPEPVEAAREEVGS